MNSLEGKTAFITGAGSGIGLGMARVFGRAGMNVVLVGRDLDKLQSGCAAVEAVGARALAIRADVIERDSLEAAADEAEQTFGRVHLVCNNAGISLSGLPIEEVSRDEWEWAIHVNVHGVINGVATFLPRLRRHGQGGHIVNTSSAAGLQVRKGLKAGAYAVTKYAVVALSEALHNELDGSGIGVSVLCPGSVNTRLYEGGLGRPARFGGPYRRPGAEHTRAALEQGADPDWIGERVRHAVLNDEFFVMTHSWLRQYVEARHRRLMEAFDRLAAYEVDHPM